jgi:hypothetical protein
MNRRSYLIAAGASVSTLLAGCMGDDSDEPTDDPGRATTTTDGEESPTTTERPETTTTEAAEQPTTAERTDAAVVDEQAALTVIDDYTAAASEGDLDALARTMHSAHPFNPDNLSEEERENLDFESRRAEAYERELVDPAFGTEDVVAALSDSSVFDGGTVSDLVAGERATLVEVRYGADGDDTETVERLIMLTEDGKWRVFWTYGQRETLPEGSADGTYDIVDGLEYDTEDERVRVNMSGVGEITAEEVTVYTESAGEGNRAWAPDSETLPDVMYLTAPFDPSGDEVVVTITVDGDETVVYREAYSPE